MASTFDGSKREVPLEFDSEASHLTIDHPRGVCIGCFKPHSLVDPIASPSEWDDEVVISTVYQSPKSGLME